MSNFLALFDLLGELGRRRYRTGERYFSALGLNHTEARLLSLLRKAGGEAGQEALSNTLYVDRTNAGRALQRLEQEGHILRSKDDTDKRANFVRMTAKGRKAAVEVAKLREQIAESFFGDLEEHEAGEIVSLLRKALSNGREGKEHLNATGREAANRPASKAGT